MGPGLVCSALAGARLHSRDEPPARGAPAPCRWTGGRKPKAASTGRPASASPSTTFDVGVDTGTPVIDDYDSRMPFAFSGKLEKVTIDLAPGTTSRSGAFRRETPPAARRPCRRQAAGRLARSHSEQARQFMGHHLVRARDLRAAHGRTELRK